MPTFTYSNSDFVAFTKARASDVNTRYNDIKTFFNTTKLDFDNIQTAGVRSTNLSGFGATTGQFLAYNGSIVLFTDNPLATQYNRIVGSAAQVTAGTAQYSTLAAAIAAASAGDRILILPGYATTENVTVDKKLLITGLGHTSIITGTVTFTSAADFSSLQAVKVTDHITLNSGADGIFIDKIWFATGKTFTDNGSGNLLFAIQE